MLIVLELSVPNPRIVLHNIFRHVCGPLRGRMGEVVDPRKELMAPPVDRGSLRRRSEGSVGLGERVEGYSMLAALLEDILRNKAFASKRARRVPHPSGIFQAGGFHHRPDYLPIVPKRNRNPPLEIHFRRQKYRRSKRARRRTPWRPFFKHKTIH